MDLLILYMIGGFGLIVTVLFWYAVVGGIAAFFIGIFGSNNDESDSDRGCEHW
jgi:hypothetical protein